MPNLVSEDLLMTKPMSSITGYLTYIQFGLGAEKGGVGGQDADGNFNTVVSDPWTLGDLDQGRRNYTSQNIVEAVAATATKIDASWTPVVGKIEAHKVADGSWVEVENGATVVAGTYDKIRYVYDNVIVPQEKLPTLVAQMKGITLEAKARRIAIQYSQLAALQAKQDYGMDFESMIADQAQAEVQYEIDGEAVQMLADAADAAVAASEIGNFTWYDEELDTLSYSLKAEGFARKIEQAKADIYKRTKKIAATWMLVSPDVMPILTFVPGFKAAGSAKAVGPYVAGTVAGLKVIVSPQLGDQVCYLGVLGNDGKTATGVFAPYVPIIPTQLLGYADGTMSQGFSTMYDMKILNRDLMAKISIVAGNGHAAVDTYEQTV